MKKALIPLIALCIFFATDSIHADSIAKPHTFQAGTPAKATEVNANFDAVYEQVNKIGSVIHIDKANQRVGVGAGSPDERLEVNGVVKATAFEGDGSGLTGITGGGRI